MTLLRLEVHMVAAGNQTPNLTADWWMTLPQLQTGALVKPIIMFEASFSCKRRKCSTLLLPCLHSEGIWMNSNYFNNI